MKYLILPLFCTLYLVGCHGCLSTLKGKIGASNDISESQKRGVFIRRYYAHDDFLLVLNHQITIKDAWLEKHWRYANDIEKSEIEDGYQLIINFEEEDVSYPTNFTIGVDADKSFRPCGVSSIMTDIEELPQGDSIEWFVQKNNYFSDSQPRDTIGKAILFTYPISHKGTAY